MDKQFLTQRNNWNKIRITTQEQLISSVYLFFGIIIKLSIYLVGLMNSNSRLVCLRNKMNNKVITLVNKEGKQKEGRAQAWEYTKRPQQSFVINKVEPEKYVFRCTNQNGWVLDLHKQKQTIYTKVIGYEYHGKKNQKWLIQPHKDGGGWVFIVSDKSGYVLEIEGGIDADGMNIVQNQNRGNKNQLWRIQQI